MAVLVRIGVVNELPVPTNEPAVASSYQLIVPIFDVAANDNFPASHLVAEVVLVMVGVVFTVATIGIRADEHELVITSA